ASYASAVTLALIYVLATRPGGSGDERLRDLPDIAPKEAGYLIPQDARMPADLIVPLGEPLRVGYVEMTPLVVQRRQVETVHFRTGQVGETTGPVLVLRLRLRNISEDAAFAPLDRRLVYYRHDQDDPDRPGVAMANQFLQASGKRYYLFGLLPESEYSLAGQKLDDLDLNKLKPGESVEVFLASEPAAAAELGNDPQTATDVLWRIHLRKGINRRTLHGVTTVVGVRFGPGEITDAEAPAPTGTATEEAS
ncbi:MAG: hypothetical protein ACOC46_04660, partial [Pirellulales bacterium]